MQGRWDCITGGSGEEVSLSYSLQIFLFVADQVLDLLILLSFNEKITLMAT